MCCVLPQLQPSSGAGRCTSILASTPLVAAHVLVGYQGMLAQATAAAAFASGGLLQPYSACVLQGCSPDFKCLPRDTHGCVLESRDGVWTCCGVCLRRESSGASLVRASGALSRARRVHLFAGWAKHDGRGKPTPMP